MVNVRVISISYMTISVEISVWESILTIVYLKVSVIVLWSVIVRVSANAVIMSIVEVAVVLVASSLLSVILSQAVRCGV